MATVIDSADIEALVVAADNLLDRLTDIPDDEQERVDILRSATDRVRNSMSPSGPVDDVVLHNEDEFA